MRPHAFVTLQSSALDVAPCLAGSYDALVSSPFICILPAAVVVVGGAAAAAPGHALDVQSPSWTCGGRWQTVPGAALRGTKSRATHGRC
jgi:hypothetical protein